MKIIQEKVLNWYKEHGRDLPWRKVRDPYKILVSEVMLQQTQVPRVLEKYLVFLKKYPHFGALADASKGQLIRDWEGMGYNNRILRLQKLAMVVRDKPFPKEPQELLKLDGIGPYTAHAVSCFAFEQDVPVVDINIRRVFSRIFYPLKYFDELRDEKEMWKLAEQLVPQGRGYDWNQALMDFGSMMCMARKANCLTCPLNHDCKSAFKLSPRKNKEKTENTKTDTTQKNKVQKKIPDRIYRGKVVQYLRTLDEGKTVTVDTIVTSLSLPLNSTWLEKILLGLQRDEVIVIKQKTKNPMEWKISLP